MTINIYKLEKWNRYVKFFFVIKNILEHIGDIYHQNIKPDKEYSLYNPILSNTKIILDELNNLLYNLIKMKNIYKLK